MHPWTLRISLTCSTGKAQQERLQGAYARGDLRLVRRIRSVLEHFVEQTLLSELSERWGFSRSCASDWIKAC
jgi:hypothetical protein